MLALSPTANGEPHTLRAASSGDLSEALMKLAPDLKVPAETPGLEPSVPGTPATS